MFASNFRGAIAEVLTSHLYRLRNPLRKRPRDYRFARLGLESLENRCMLAVGTFTRVDGDVVASVTAQTYSANQLIGNAEHDDGDQADALAHAAAKAQLGEDGVFLFAEEDGNAIAFPSMGSTAAAPYVSASLVEKRVADVTSAFGVARGTADIFSEASVVYQADSEFTENLQLHVHLFLAVNGGVASRTGDAEFGFPATVGVQVGSAGIGAGYISDLDAWYYSANIPGHGEISGTSQGGVSLHYKFVSDFSDGAGATLTAYVSNTDGGSEAVAYDGRLSFLASHLVTAWVYVTATGSDDQPGDFDHDGDIDFDDFNMWETGDPRADAKINGAYDGVIDDNDLAVWADNAQDFGIFMVSAASDELDTNYGFSDLSLREALLLASNYSGSSTILFSPTLFSSGPANILLADQLDQLLIDSDIAIDGPGADLLTINAQGNSRVFNIASGANVTISGVTISGGRVTGTNDGAGIYNAGNLTLQAVVMTENHADDHGGAVYNTGGTAHIIDSTLSLNSAAVGGAISSRSDAIDSIVIENSAIVMNEASSNAGGVRLDDLSNISGPSARFINSTFSGNTSANAAGAIQGTPSFSLTIINSTITANTATTAGGGIRTSGASVILHNTILAENSAGTAETEDHEGTALTSSSSYNLIGPNVAVNGGGNGEGTIRLITGQSAGLTALGNYGGPTMTHALVVQSPAINAASDSVAINHGLEFDQRGLNREFDGRVDIGAYESGNPTSLVVTITADENDGNLSANDLSLREALAIIGGIPGADSITFGELFNEPQTITLSHAPGFGQLIFPSQRNVSIIGPGRDKLTIHANSSATQYGRAFYIPNQTWATISGITITGGDVGSTFGGGIYSGGFLTLIDVRITQNKAGRGGGIAAIGDSLSIIRSEIDHNTASISGGGIYFVSSDPGLTIESSTVSFNNASSYGAMYLHGKIDIRNSTISSNTADSYGGVLMYADPDENDYAIMVNSTITNNSSTSGDTSGIHVSFGAPVLLLNSIVAQNYVATIEKDVHGSFDTNSQSNLIGAIDGSTGLNATTTLYGTTLTPINALLEALDGYGGPTQTHRLSVDSPAINNGHNGITSEYGLVFDQRGFTRISFGNVDIGAFELAIEDLFA
ncbi:MAG: choice-of-anchor Q domain-containing protein [Pirellulales bacterium]